MRSIYTFVVVAYNGRLPRPRILAAAMDLLFATDEDYCLKDMYFAICRSKNIILYTESFLFNVMLIPSRLDLEATSLSIRELPLV